MSRRPVLFVAVLLFASLITGVISPKAHPLDNNLRIKVLSNRADLISDDNALVEIVIPDRIDPYDVRVAVDGYDVTVAFDVRDDGRFYGLIEGLGPGDNEIMARVVDASSSKPVRTPALITIINHPVGGPVFSGEQLQPWICATSDGRQVEVTVPDTDLSAWVATRVSGLDDDPYDEQCNAPAKYSYYYQPKHKEGTSCTFTITGVNPCFQPYDPDNPPDDDEVADFTNDRGDTVKSIVLYELGTMNRGMYQLVTFFDPSAINAPWNPPKGWNGKLLWNFGAASGVSRFQEPPGTSVWTDTALRRGFMVASASLTDHSKNANDTLAAETVMMVKEHIIENYGEIRYTIGSGASGGAILQQNIAGAYPGLLNGIRPAASFPDSMTTSIEVGDCGCLQDEYYSGLTEEDLSLEQRAAVNGHLNTGFCARWIATFLPNGDPTRASNCGTGFPEELVYDPVERPDGVRCTVADHDVGMLGTFVDADGITKAQAPYDNEGVQYGLKALQDGVISAEQFVALNYGVGGYTADLVWTGPASPPGMAAPRRKATSLNVLNTVYRAGLVTNGRQLAKTAMIDLRNNQPPIGDVHMNWRAWSIRDRIQKANGHHDNHLIWAFTNVAYLPDSLDLMDRWLADVESDTSDLPIEEKIRINKPLEATDLCMVGPGTDAGLDSEECPVKYQASPRQAAGGPLAENIMKCQLKALDCNDPDYAGITFTAEQKNRLMQAFPNGVCDWSKPGVSQAEADGWTTFVDGPGGQPLGEPPLSEALCPFPEIAGYTGEGSRDLSDSYICIPPVRVRIKPETLSLHRSKIVTAFITVPVGYDIRNYPISDVVCQGAPMLKSSISQTGRTLICKFDSDDLVNVAPGRAVIFLVQGVFQVDSRQTPFSGRDFVRVIK